MRRGAGGAPGAALAIAIAAAAGLAACGDGGGEQPSELEQQVARVVADGAGDVGDRLRSFGVDVATAELEALEGGDVRCPRVGDPDPGDRATCDFAVGSADVLVDVEFGEDGSLVVIGVEVQMVAAGDDVEGAVAALLAARLGGQAPEVSCPDADSESGGPGPGATVECQLDVGGADAAIALHVDDDGDLVLDTAVFARADVEAFLADELRGTAGGEVEVGCGDVDVLVVAVDGELACEAARVDDGAEFDVEVRVGSVDGDLTYDVRPR